MDHNLRRRRLRTGWGLWALGCGLVLGLIPGGRGETVDCILALVNDSLITLSDVRLVEAFGLMPPSSVPGAEGPRALLDRMINRKIVIDLARGQTSIPPAEVETALDGLRQRLPAGAFEARLAEYGLSPEDLKPYLEEQLLYQAIINQRFGQSVAVTLKEIEAYYQGTYVPDQNKKGLPAAPLLQVLGELEAAIRNSKIVAEVESWVGNLRLQAEVILKDDCLKQLKEAGR